jgi:hypothetical protein
MIIGACVLGLGCWEARPTLEDLTVWKAEARSPDGQWLATARTVQNGGFGSANIDTYVELKRTNVAGSAKTVLDFDCDGPVPRPYTLDNVANKGGTINLTMNWANPSRLDVTYDGPARIDLQVANYAGIDISLRNRTGVPPARALNARQGGQAR